MTNQLQEFTVISAVTGKITTGMQEIEVPEQPEPTPEEARASLPPITARQLRLALLSRLDEVESIIVASNDRALQIEWEYATTFERLHPAIVSIGAELNLTPEEIDTLWTDAANT